jgi:hypothetical protein
MAVLALGGAVSPGAEVEVHPTALPFDLVDLPLAVLLASRLQRDQLGIPR